MVNKKENLLMSKASSTTNYFGTIQDYQHNRDILKTEPGTIPPITPRNKKQILKDKIKNYSPVTNYNYDKYIFDKKLHKKRDYLTHVSNKEIKFQKSILNLKTFEKIYISKPMDEYEILRDVKVLDRKFFRTNYNIETDPDALKNELFKKQNVLEEKKLDQLRNKVLSSLNPKALVEYMKLTDEQRIEKEKEKNKLITQDSQFYSENIEKNNYDSINHLNKDITFLQTLENITEKDFNPKKKKKQRPFTGKPNMGFTTRTEKKLGEQFVRGSYSIEKHKDSKETSDIDLEELMNIEQE